MKRQRFFHLLPLLLLCASAAFLLPRRHRLTAEAILLHTPDRPLAVALFLLALYALKGLSFFFPLAALEAAGGLLFPTGTALLVNVLGVCLTMSLPYCLGRGEQGGLNAVVRRHPKLAVLRKIRQDSDFFFVFLLRLTGVLPGDLVSLYLGAAGIPFPTYLPAGILGALPHIAAVTLLGSFLSDPTDGKFFITLAANAAVTVFSLALWRMRKSRIA